MAAMVSTVMACDTRSQALEMVSVDERSHSTIAQLIAKQFRCRWGNHIAAELPAAQPALTIFHASNTPAVDISDYFLQLAQFTQHSAACCLCTVIYLRRLMERHSYLHLSRLCAHRFVLAAFVVAAKFVEDTYYDNKYMAELGGLPTTELNMLEVEFLTLLSYDLSVDTSELQLLIAELRQQT